MEVDLKPQLKTVLFMLWIGPVKNAKLDTLFKMDFVSKLAMIVSILISLLKATQEV